MSSVKVLNWGLDEDPATKTVILRGVIDPDSLQHLRVGEYQRDVLPLASLASLVDAIKRGDKVPDIELGMRGQREAERDGGEQGREETFHGVLQ